MLTPDRKSLLEIMYLLLGKNNWHLILPSCGASRTCLAA
jgi:hypothetical protein